jgi:RHS repeat-associated protein
VDGLAVTKYARKVRTIQERDGSNNPLVSYTRGNDLSGSMEGAGGIGGLLARSSGYSAGNFTTHNYYFADGNGNITYMLDSSQAMVASYRYGPIGDTFSSSGTLASANVYRFSSKEIHASSGMYYYGYRFYDPNLQRWINRDPYREVGFEIARHSVSRPGGRPLPPSELVRGRNLYVFVNDDPVDLFDPLGLVVPGTGVGKNVCQLIRPCSLSACLDRVDRDSTALAVSCILGCALAGPGGYLVCLGACDSIAWEAYAIGNQECRLCPNP